MVVMNNAFELLIEGLFWMVGGFLVYQAGGWTLLIAMWILLTANNILMFRRYREYSCKQNTEE